MIRRKKDFKAGFKRRDKEMDFGPVRKKFCRFCVEKIKAIDYKDVRRLEKTINERCKILPRKISGVCAPHQRKLSNAIKLARYLALMPYART